MKKLKIIKSVKIDEEALVKIGVKQGVLENKFNWKLIRERDGLVKRSKDIKWIEWNEDSTFKESHSTYGVGRSLIMSPFNSFYTWQTTEIVEVIEDDGHSFVKFSTKNSVYTLIKLT